MKIPEIISVEFLKEFLGKLMEKNPWNKICRYSWRKLEEWIILELISGKFEEIPEKIFERVSERILEQIPAEIYLEYF